MSTLDDALSAACVLLTEDHWLVEALSAARRDRPWFRPDYDRELIETSAHLDAVELEADTAANMCANTGLPALADCCRKIANRIGLAKRQGTDDTCAIADLARLTGPAVEELDRASDEYAAGCSRH